MPFRKLWLSRRSHNKNARGRHVCLGQEANVTAHHYRISALPPMADIDHRRIDVRFVPKEPPPRAAPDHGTTVILRNSQLR